MEDFKPITNSINKFERKFICIKKHKLDEYLTGISIDTEEKAEYLHEYYISQKYLGNIKYRKYTYISRSKPIITCTKHIKHKIDDVNKQVEIQEISLAEYESISANELIKLREAYRIVGTNIYLDIDTFKNNKDLNIIEVWSEDKEQLSSYKPFKGLIEVTGNKEYGNEFIARHIDNITTRPVIVMEGTDLIGKTTIVEQLVRQGYICMDRDQYDFSNYIQLGVSAEESAENIVKKYKKYNRLVVALYTDKEETLRRRLQQRLETAGHLSEYDNLCIEYNTLYKEIIKLLLKDNYMSSKVLAINIAKSSTEQTIESIRRKVGSMERKVEESNSTRKKVVYIASKFRMEGHKDLPLHRRLINDFRSKLLGSSEKLTINIGLVEIPECNALYAGPFYCEQASNGNYTSTDCNTVVKEEIKAVDEADTFITYLDENYSCGSITELIYAALKNKNILIVYKEESEVKYATKSEHWFAITAALQFNERVQVKKVETEEEVIDAIKNYLKTE